MSKRSLQSTVRDQRIFHLCFMMLEKLLKCCEMHNAFAGNIFPKSSSELPDVDFIRGSSRNASAKKTVVESVKLDAYRFHIYLVSPAHYFCVYALTRGRGVYHPKYIGNATSSRICI